MGVLRVTDPRPVRADNEQHITYEDYIFDDEVETNDDTAVVDSDSNDEHNPVPTTTTHRRRRHKVDDRSQRRFGRFLELDYPNMQIKSKRKSMGARKLRRLENARLIYALVDPDDICEDYSDILPSTITNFTKLFMEQQNMRAWNEFVEKDEEEQRSFLERGRFRDRNIANNDETVNDNKSGLNAIQGHRLGTSRNAQNRVRLKSFGGGSIHQQDGPSKRHRPVYSATECFLRMETRFQTIFLQKRLPWSFIKSIEEQLRAHFEEPSSERTNWFSDVITSAWYRLLVHGISQYLSLQSTSIKKEDEGGVDKDDKKLVKVNNPRPFFIPPHKNIVEFVHEVRKNKRVDDWYDD
ncbi:unnamed protein product [Anisakis simplex]|uniref:R3H-assoc domain-containing protein n=1 Tax=Anisakis simplex TaxID=6269 RepID=A0A158PPI6_ANISI|nr:unnamed protein product [Anisakis simplex]